MKRPAYTVFYNVRSPGSPWVGMAWEFYDNHESAMKRFGALFGKEVGVTKRPYHHETDKENLGGCHRFEIEKTK
jgi:hypothetical protein